MRSLVAVARSRRHCCLLSTIKKYGSRGGSSGGSTLEPLHGNQLSSLLFFSTALRLEGRGFSSSAVARAAGPGQTRSPRGKRKPRSVAPKVHPVARAPVADTATEAPPPPCPQPSPPAGKSDKSPAHRTTTAANLTTGGVAASSPEEVVIDMGALVAEWRALVCDVQLHAADNPLLAAQGAPAVAAPSTKRVVRQELNLAERAILLTSIQERGESYPYLFALFNIYVDSDSSSEVKVPVQLRNFEDVFKDETVTSWYLFLLKMYGQLARQRAALLPTYVQLSASTTGYFASQKNRQRPQITYMKVMFLNELFRSLSAVDTAKVARPGKGEAEEELSAEEDESIEEGAEGKAKRRKKKKRARKIRQEDLEVLHFQKICQQMSVQFLEKCVGPLTRHAEGSKKSEVKGSVSDCILEEAFWSLAADVGASVLPSLSEGEQDTIHCAEWRRLSKKAAAHVRLLLDEPLALEGQSAQMDALPTEQLRDVIDGLRYMQELELVLPHAQRQLIETRATDTVQQVCALAANNEDLLLALASAELARRVESIRRQQAGEQVPTRAYTQVCTCIFAAIAHLLSSPALVHTLCETAEATCHAALKARGATVPARPSLHSPRAELCYALLCAGYAPDAILKSALCTALPVVDLVDVVRAAALFSDHFSYEALPARVRTSLKQTAHALIDQAMRDTRRMVSQPQPPVDGKAVAAKDSLAERLLHFKPKDEQGHFVSLETASFFSDAEAKKRQMNKKRRLQRSKKQKRQEKEAEEEDGEAIQVTTAADVRAAADEAFYVSLSYIVEALVRGEAQEAQQLLIAVLPLLESEGGVLMVANALEHLVGQVGERLRQCGRLRQESLQLTHALCEPPAALEEGLELVSSIVLPRVSQSVQRLIARSTGTDTSTAGGSRQKHVITSAKEEEELQYGLSAQTVAQLVEPLTVHYTAAAITCGTPPSAVAQLVTLHQVLLKADAGTPGQQLEQTLARVGAFLAQVEKLQFASSRPPRSAAGRYTNTAINEIVAVQIQHGAEALRENKAAATAADHHNAASGKAAIALVRLLYKVNTAYPVATEPAVIHDLRVELLDPLLTHTVLADPQQPASLLLLSEIAHIMCRRESVHHISVPFYTALAQSVKARVERRTTGAATAQEGGSGNLGPHATRLLLASVLVCLRGELFLGSFLIILDATGDLVALGQARSVLHELLQVGGPVGCASARRMRERLLQALQSHKTSMLLTDRVEALQTIVQCEKVDPTRSLEGGTPYLHEMVLRLTQPSVLPRLRLSSCGILVAIVADLKEMSTDKLQSGAADDGEEERVAAFNALPARLAELILPRLQNCEARDVPGLVHGYAQLPAADATFRSQMLRAFISRTIRAVPQLTPTDIVCCVQAYCRAAVYHQYLFGILLSKMSDSPQSVTLELSVQLLQCGMGSTLPEVRRACLTAAKPIFLAHVRHVLQHDQHMLAAVASVSVVVLQCLREGFSKDPICGLVLEAIARHHHAAGLSVMKAALRLIAARGSSDFDSLRILSDSCIHQQLPTCEINVFAGLTYWLVQCGVHSVVLLQCVKARLVALHDEQQDGRKGRPTKKKTSAPIKALKEEKTTGDTMRGESLALLAQAFERAFVESDTTILNVMAAETIRMVDTYRAHVTADAAAAAHVVPPFSLPQVAALLNYYYAAGPAQIAPLRPAVDALLSYLRLVAATVPSWSPAEVAAATSGPTVTPLHLIAILRACGTQSSGASAHAQVSLYGADVAAACLARCTAANGGDDAWRGAELLPLVQLADLLTDYSAEVRAHTAVKLLLDVLYDRRTTLLQRQLLRTTAQNAVRRVPSVHPDLSQQLEIDPHDS